MALGICMSTPFDRFFTGWHAGAADPGNLVSPQEFVCAARRASLGSAGLAFDKCGRKAKDFRQTASDLQPRERVRRSRVVNAARVFQARELEQELAKRSGIDRIPVFLGACGNGSSRLPAPEQFIYETVRAVCVGLAEDQR